MADNPNWAKLLPAAAEGARQGLAETDYAKREALLSGALKAVGFPESPRGPSALFVLAGELTVEQRAMAELLADAPSGLGSFAWPRTAHTRKQWLGRAEASALSTPVTIVRDGASREVPLWLGMQLLGIDYVKQAELRLTLPIQTNLAALEEIYYEGHAYDFNTVPLFNVEFHHMGERCVLFHIGNECGDWARGAADRLLTYAVGAQAGMKLSRPLGDFAGPLAWPVFVALVRAKVAIEARWEPLLPLGMWSGRGATTRECVLGLAEGRRAQALAARFGTMGPAAEALALLEDFPVPELVRCAFAQYERNDAPLKPFWAVVDPLGKKHPVIAETVAAIRANLPKPLKLVCLSYLKPAKVDDLTPIQQEQLRLGANGMDGADLPVSARFAADNSETSLLGDIEFRVIGDAKREPLYEAFSYADGGVVYKVGTTEEVAQLIQGGLSCTDRPLKKALTAVLREKPSPAKKAAPSPKKAPKPKKAR